MQEACKARRALDQRWLALSTFALGICRSANCVVRPCFISPYEKKRPPYHVLTRSPLTPAVAVLIVGLQDADKIGHAGSIPVFGDSRNLSIGPGFTFNNQPPNARDREADLAASSGLSKCAAGHNCKMSMGNAVRACRGCMSSSPSR
jgi:hypothetical protein